MVITDFDDKIIKRASEVLPPTVYMRVTEKVWARTKGAVNKRYSCDLTVYDHAHLGHACSYVRFDIVQMILTRVFRINVIHVMVITDIDDKIIKRASEPVVKPLIALSLFQVLPPTVYMRVTENIPPIIAFIEGIINNQHTNATPKDVVYFDIKSIGRQYGKLLGWFVDSGGELGDTGDTDKRNARDSALWKAFKPQEPFWEAPWGKGRPGWHIECSTIARVAAAKVSVQTVLTDDFDTPRAVDAIMGLIHHGNQQLQAVTKCVTGESSPGILPSVVELLVRFQSWVRSYALATDELALVLSDCSQLSEKRKSQLKEHRKQQIREREPLLKACDVLRGALAPLGINIKDRGNTSTWEITEKRTELQKEEAN
ncbi:UNVERIFIED_CONTAM: hypothetical protein FKN15_064550 [Acipenser sinensis]